jgi:hypothetical protein
VAASYIVKAPLIIARTSAGTDSYIYRGGPIPGDVDKDRIKGWLDEGLIVEASEAVAVDERTAEPEQPAGDDKPAGNASLEDWQAYARSQGMADADLEGMSRNELRDLYV